MLALKWLRLHTFLRVSLAPVMLMSLLFGSLPKIVLGQNVQDTITLPVIAGDDHLLDSDAKRTDDDEDGNHRNGPGQVGRLPHSAG